ncbi:MAG TPA: PLD nuclease N-terminal domain-containing protein [Roseimicrobium sp.]|nr:PLD nuclease N-terminal domain-containing protein [Roseimicrobium sp.]
MIFIPSLAVLSGLLLLGLLATAFWVWMLVHAIQNEGLDQNQKLIWVLVIVFTSWIGATVYFFIGRPKKPTR